MVTRSDTSHIPLDSQIIYKLGIIESQVSAIGDKLNAVVERLERRISEDRHELDRDYIALETRVNRNEKRLEVVDEWRKTIITRVSMAVTAISIFWVVIGDIVTEKVGNIF
jgi:hypothetical protein